MGTTNHVYSRRAKNIEFLGKCLNPDDLYAYFLQVLQNYFFIFYKKYTFTLFFFFLIIHLFYY